MKVIPSKLPDVKRIRSAVHRDARGWVAETWRADLLAEHGIPASFAQENLTWSRPGTLRGLHFQEVHAQGKLVQVLVGHIWDVAVDLRAGSPTRGRWVALDLDADRPESLWIPPGFAHGFYVSAGPALVLYKLTATWSPAWERCLAWDDPTLAIPWPLRGEILLSERDRQGRSWADTPPWHPEESG